VLAGGAVSTFLAGSRAPPRQPPRITDRLGNKHRAVDRDRKGPITGASKSVESARDFGSWEDAREAAVCGADATMVHY
jgi:hypothetical protein